MNIRILGISPYRFLPAVNGGHKAIEQLYRNIGPYTKTIVVSTKNNSVEFAVNYRLVKLFSNSTLRYINVFYYFRLKALIRDEQITHLILEHPYMAWLGFLLKRTTNIILVIRSHNIEAIRFKTINKWWWKLLWYYERWAYQIADKVCLITREDEDYAVQYFQLAKNKCFIKPFGTELRQPPLISAKQAAKMALQRKHHLPAAGKIILFNGSFSYQPNIDALNHLLNVIHPLLQKASAYSYTILICGMHIPEQILSTSSDNIVIAGFVEDVGTYFLGADIFVCPITAGGGIKTKLVEALAYDDTCVSYSNSAIGIDEKVCNGKLLIAEDHNVEQIVSLLQQALEMDNHITAEFFAHYSSQGTAENFLKTLQHSFP